MTEEKLPEYPTSDPRSFGYEVARTAMDAAASMIPGASYAVGAIVQHVVTEPLQKRRDAWFERVGYGLRELEERMTDFDPSKLAQNDEFISAVFEATQAAMKTAKEEKLEALRSAVLNLALGKLNLDEVLRSSFFTYIDRFTPAHVAVLKLLADPRSSPEAARVAEQMMAGGPIEVIKAGRPSGMSDAALQRVLADLAREDLAETGGLNTTVSQASLLSKRSTAAGDAFLRFIADPLTD